MNGADLIQYGYLNMDTKKFVIDYEELLEQVSHSHHRQERFVGEEGMHVGLEPHIMMRAIPNYEHSQVLYAAGTYYFTEQEAQLVCRRIMKQKDGAECAGTVRT